MIVRAKRSWILSLLLLLSFVAAGRATEYSAAVETLDVSDMGDAVEFTITSTEPIRYTYFELDGPRLVVDFHESENRMGYHRTPVGLAGVESVRVASFKNDKRDVTRFVFDLERETPYAVADDGEGRVRVRFGELEVSSAPVVADTPDEGAVGVASEEQEDAAPQAAVPGVAALEESVPEESVSEETAANESWEESVPVESNAEEIVAAAALDPDRIAFETPRLEVEGLSATEAPLAESAPVSAGRATAEPLQLSNPAAFPVADTAETLSEDTELDRVAQVASTAPAALPLVEPVRKPAVSAAQFAAIEPQVTSALTGTLPAVQVQAPLAPGAGAAPPPPPASPFLVQEEVEAPEPEYTGEIVSFDLVGTDIVDFFRVIAELSGLNIIVDDQVAGQLNLVLNNVPWDQALDLVLRTNQLGYELQGNILRIATQQVLTAEEQARQALRDAQALAVPLETRPFILSYTLANNISAAVTQAQLLSSRGTILQDARRNALIVTDVPARFEQIESLIDFLDTPQQQVEIEARLLSATKSFSRNLGSQLALLIGNNSQNNFAGLPTVASPVNRTPAPAVNVGGALPLLANFPGAADSGFSFLLGAGGDILLDEIINMAEDNGTGKLLSRPRVTTQNNQPATVSQGTQIPVQTNVNNTISVEFIAFDLSLQVTPQITEAGTIMLTANITNSSPDFGRAVGGVPVVSSQQANTQVLIPDGGTAVIGGILVDNDSVNVSQFPGLGSIPIIGNLFKSTSTVKSTSELLFFITARIKPSDPLEFLTGSIEEESELFGGTLEEPTLQ